MITDNIQNASLYISLHERFAAAFAFLQKAAAEQLPAGRYELEGEALYANIQEYSTRPAENARPEGHRKYIDIQYILEGEEAIGVTDIAHAAVDTPYDPETDAGFFAPPAKQSRIILRRGEFAVFYPHDLHTPCLISGQTPEPVKKVVVKVAL